MKFNYDYYHDDGDRDGVGSDATGDTGNITINDEGNVGDNGSGGGRSSSNSNNKNKQKRAPIKQ